MISSSGGASVQDMTSSVVYFTDVSFPAIYLLQTLSLPFFEK